MTRRSRPQPWLVLVAGAFALVALGCTPSTPTATDDASTTTADGATTTTIEPGLTSGEPASVPTTDPTTETTVVPTSTTTTTTTIPSPPVNVREDLEVDPIFDPILDELIELTDLPIRLPADLGLGPDPVANLTSVDDDHYIVHLGVGPGCTGGNVCRIGTLTAHRLTSLSDPQTIVGGGTSVPLPAQGDGLFFDATCGANCGDGVVQWIEDEIVYTVGAKLAPGPDMLDWAWSSIDAEADTPQPPEFCGPETVAADGKVAATVAAGPDVDGLYWLVVCSEDGLFAEVLDSPSTPRWFTIGSNQSALAVEDSVGSTTVFRVGPAPEALMDIDTLGRFRAQDLRCGDVNGDGRIELADAATDTVYEITTSAVAIEIAADVSALPRC